MNVPSCASNGCSQRAKLGSDFCGVHHGRREAEGRERDAVQALRDRVFGLNVADDLKDVLIDLLDRTIV